MNTTKTKAVKWTNPPGSFWHNKWLEPKVDLSKIRGAKNLGNGSDGKSMFSQRGLKLPSDAIADYVGMLRTGGRKKAEHRGPKKVYHHG